MLKTLPKISLGLSTKRARGLGSSGGDGSPPGCVTNPPAFAIYKKVITSMGRLPLLDNWPPGSTIEPDLGVVKSYGSQLTESIRSVLFQQGHFEAPFGSREIPKELYQEENATKDGEGILIKVGIVPWVPTISSGSPAFERQGGLVKLT